jgi:hypothetical protein
MMGAISLHFQPQRSAANDGVNIVTALIHSRDFLRAGIPWRCRASAHRRAQMKSPSQLCRSDWGLLVQGKTTG